MSAEEKIDKLADMIRDITPDEIKELEDMHKRQQAYTHPFKYATAAKVNKAGDDNEQVVECVKKLKHLFEKYL